MSLDFIPQVGSPDFALTGERLGREFCTKGYVLLKLRSEEQNRLTATQTVLKSVTGDAAQHPLQPSKQYPGRLTYSYSQTVLKSVTGDAAPHLLQPSKQYPGRLTYSYSLGQDVQGVPECWSTTAAQVENIAFLYPLCKIA